LPQIPPRKGALLPSHREESDVGKKRPEGRKGGTREINLPILWSSKGEKRGPTYRERKTPLAGAQEKTQEKRCLLGKGRGRAKQRSKQKRKIGHLQKKRKVSFGRWRGERMV